MPIHTTYSQARESLAHLLDQVTEQLEPVYVSRRGKRDAVILDAQEYEGLLETVHLMRSPANLRRLLEALKRSEAGEGEVMSVEQLADSVGLKDEFLLEKVG